MLNSKKKPRDLGKNRDSFTVLIENRLDLSDPLIKEELLRIQKKHLQDLKKWRQEIFQN